MMCQSLTVLDRPGESQSDWVNGKPCSSTLVPKHGMPRKG